MATKMSVPIEVKLRDSIDQPDAEHDIWLRAKIERAIEQSRDASSMIDAEQIWRDLGLES